MTREQFEFTIQEAGCLLYVGDKNLNKTPWAEMHVGNWKELALEKALLMMSLYQDDGYSVRVVLGDLTNEEQNEWTARASWQLNLESGEMVVSGVCDEDLEEYMEEFEVGENGGEYEFGCFLDLPKGNYKVDVYSYPPNDLAGGLLVLENRREFREYFGDSAVFEKTLDYFNRTHPDETAPGWIRDGYEDAAFLDFVVHLEPFSQDMLVPHFDEDENCLKWEYRQPEVCPVGIRIEQV